mmetsp:Transcript_19243/g.31598  ORF Transcript_19243/g.31598 Transcript_19243/m.31598 type:complete len:409 (-) Transcript_19243:38-1264(-)
MSFTPCKVDNDCPATKICYIGVEWGPTTEGFCQCNTWYGYQGDNCDEFGTTTNVMLAVIIFQIVIGVVLACFALSAWFKYMYTFRKDLLSSPATLVTLTAATLAVVSFVVCRLLVVLSTASPNAHDAWTSWAEDATKTDVYTLAARPFIFLTQLFTVVAALHVSVLWVEIANNANKMRVNNVKTVTKYRRAVVVTEILFGIAIGVVAALGKFQLSVVVGLPFITIMIVTFLVGRHRMVSLLNVTLTSSVNEGSSSAEKSKEKDAIHRTRRAMRAINRCSLLVVIGLVGVLIFSLLYFIMGSTFVFDAGWKKFAPYGSFASIYLINDVMYWSMFLVQVAVLHYSYRNAMKLIRRKLGIHSGSTTTSSFQEAEGSSYPTSKGPGKGALSTNFGYNDPADSFVETKDEEEL